GGRHTSTAFVPSQIFRVPFLRGGDEQVTPRFRGDDKVLLRLPRLGKQDELHLAPFHGFARLRMQVAVSNIAASVDEGTHLDLSFRRACEDLVRERRHGLRGATAKGPKNVATRSYADTLSFRGMIFSRSAAK